MITEKQRQQMLAQLEEMSKTASKLSEAAKGFSEADKLGISYDRATTQHQDLAQQIAQTKSGGGDYSLPSIPSLPTMDMTNVQDEDVLAMALKNIAQLAQREGKVTGLAATSKFFSDRGILPEDLPGSSVANMLSVVDRAMTDPVAERAESIADLVDIIGTQRMERESSMKDQLNLLMDSGAFAELTDEAVYGLGKEANMNPDYLIAIRNAQKEQLSAPTSFSIQEVNGARVRFGFDSMGKIVSETELGTDVSTPTTLKFEPKQLNQLAAIGIDPATAQSFSQRLANGETTQQIKSSINTTLQRGAQRGELEPFGADFLKRLQEQVDAVQEMLLTGTIDETRYEYLFKEYDVEAWQQQEYN